MAKPIQFTSVRAVPFNSGATAEATKFENCGESAVTAIPQMHQPAKNRYKGSENRRGETIQRNPDMVNANNATFLLPIL